MLPYFLNASTLYKVKERDSKVFVELDERVAELDLKSRLILINKLILQLFDLHTLSKRTGFIHRYVKGENILVYQDEKGQLDTMFVDLGSAEKIDALARERKASTYYQGTVDFMPPESFSSIEGTFSDSFSFSIICLTLLGVNGENPLFFNAREVSDKGLFDGIPDIDKSLGEEKSLIESIVRDFLKRCRNPDYKERASLDDAKKFFSTFYNFCELDKEVDGQQRARLLLSMLALAVNLNFNPNSHSLDESEFLIDLYKEAYDLKSLLPYEASLDDLRKLYSDHQKVINSPLIKKIINNRFSITFDSSNKHADISLGSAAIMDAGLTSHMGKAVSRYSEDTGNMTLVRGRGDGARSVSQYAEENRKGGNSKPMNEKRKTDKSHPLTAGFVLASRENAMDGFEEGDRCVLRDKKRREKLLAKKSRDESRGRAETVSSSSVKGGGDVS